jgi:hypothetical protein
MKVSPSDVVSRVAIALALAGVAPFAILSLCCGAAGRHSALLEYGAIILSFVGAVHWGAALSSGSSEARRCAQLVWSVVPPLGAWAVMTGLNAAQALFAMAGLMLVCWLVDLLFSRASGLPRWYVTLRSAIAPVVAAFLVLAALKQ